MTIKSSEESPAVSSRRPTPMFARSKTSGTVWDDPDDQTLRISIASDKRLRKLRDGPSEDVITGNEYERRLRRQ